MLERGPFDPGRHVIATAELLAFPRAQRFQRMHRMHQRNAIEGLCQDTAKVRVPGVYMHQISVDLVAQRFEVGFEGIQRTAELLVDMRETSLAERVALDSHAITADGVLVAKGADFDMHQSWRVRQTDTRREHRLRRRRGEDTRASIGVLSLRHFLCCGCEVDVLSARRSEGLVIVAGKALADHVDHPLLPPSESCYRSPGRSENTSLRYC
jgi:hypothetical protein